MRTTYARIVVEHYNETKPLRTRQTKGFEKRKGKRANSGMSGLISSGITGLV